MESLYERIAELCENRGVKPGRMCGDLGLSRGLMSDLKAGRKRTLSSDTMTKIAGYFDVSVDYLLGKGASDGGTDGEDGLEQLLEQLKTRPECRMLFKLARGATKEDVLQAVKIIEALREKGE